MPGHVVIEDGRLTAFGPGSYPGEDGVTAPRSVEKIDASRAAADQPRTADAFGRSVRYEIAFWQMAYTRGESDRA
ncbi:MAG TPA: hypothetical protein VFW50_10710 [Streptosporangiaceae bacterium]|nr:hypothetical protein [Streptosporangiaceae bacterium]